MLKFLLKPSPILFSVKVRFIISFAIAIFVFAFLFIFEPFGVFEKLLVSKLMACLGFGLIVLTLNISFLFGWNYWFIRNYEQRWTTWRQLVSIFIHVSIISLINVIYSQYIFSSELGEGKTLFERIIDAQFYAHSIAFMPTIFMMTFAELKMREMYSKQSENVYASPAFEKEISRVKIKTDHSENEIELSSDSFKFAKASGNYVELFYSKEDKVVKDLQRITLSKFEEQVSNSGLNVMKTHRSYVVNLDSVQDVQGNAQGYVLSLTSTDEKVPVARNNVDGFNLLMNS
jgi:hypothetical protein